MKLFVITLSFKTPHRYHTFFLRPQARIATEVAHEVVVYQIFFYNMMKDIIRLILIFMLLGREFHPSFINIGVETYKSISSLYSYYEYKAEKIQIQQCEKIMNSALDEIDFLQDFEAKQMLGIKLIGIWQIENTTRIDLYYEHDEQLSWYVKVLKDKKIQFSFYGLNWSTSKTIDFEAESPMLLKIDAKEKIKAFEDLGKKAIQMLDKSYDLVFDSIFNVIICSIILLMMLYEVEGFWLGLPMFQLSLILVLQGWIRMTFLRKISNDFDGAYGWFWYNWYFWFEYKWAYFSFLMLCPLCKTK